MANLRLGQATLERHARRVLDGVGDATLGEWAEPGITRDAFHLRRRLTPAEAEPIGPVIDVRGTPEQASRYMAVLPYFPPGVNLPPW